MTADRQHAVPVRGGTLHVGEWGPADGAPLLAIHGITASHLAWAELAAALPDRRIIAPDLRGRGASATLPGPYGMVQHATDLAAVLDYLGIATAPLVGHSMGAFVALVTALEHPDRVSSVLLVDGGLTLRLPPGMSLADSTALLGPAAERLAMTFPTREAYREYWKRHPAFASHWSPLIAEYVDYDLVGTEPQLRSRTSAQAMRDDSLELYGSAEVVASVAALPAGTTLLTAPRGLLDQTPGLYPADVLQQWQRSLPTLTITEVPDTNHYTIVMTPEGASAVAAAVEAAEARAAEAPAPD